MSLKDFILAILGHNKPKPAHWDLGVTVSPADAKVYLYIDEAVNPVIGAPETPGSAQHLIHLVEPPNHRGYGAYLHVEAPGYDGSVTRVNTEYPGSPHVQLDNVILMPAIPIYFPREPLPPFDPTSVDPESGAVLPVNKTVTGSIPPFGDPSYMRANLWGVTIPGLPAIPGGASGPAQERFLSYLFYAYPPEWQKEGLLTYGECGYRHFWMSWPDARSRGGQSVADYVADAKRVKAAGLIPCHFLRSKDYDGPNPDPHGTDEVVQALLAENLISWAAHAWEASIFYSPEALRATIDHDATTFPSIRWCIHLQQGYADFGPDGEGHGPLFWNANIAVGVKTLLYQYKTEPAWSAGMMQARGNDVSVRLIAGGLWGLPETVTWIPFELVAVCQFNNLVDGDGRVSDEDTGDLKGFEMLCTPGPLAPGGFGNGARYPDGSVI